MTATLEELTFHSFDAKAAFYDWGGFNLWLFHQINGLQPGEVYDQAMQLITLAGDRHLFPYYMAFLMCCALSSAIVRKFMGSINLKRQIYRWLGVLLVFGIGYVAVAAVIYGLKDYFQYPRPFIALQEGTFRVIGGLPELEKHWQTFPSGHAAFITLAVQSLRPVMNHLLRFLGWLLILMVCWSRIALGMHFPADVLAGFLLAWMVTALLQLMLYKWMGLLHK